jgi:hypothetical protein
MALFDKPLAQIDEHDLLRLISDKAAESKTHDYKRDLVAQADGDKKEFLYDASSFANTQGGHLIFGMAEAKGVPTELVGFNGIDADKEIIRLEQMCRDGIRPPVSVESRAVPLSGGRVAIIMRIPRSWNPPHQVTFQKAFRFYARDSNGKYQVDVDELRAVFALSGTIADRIREFRADRIAKIAAGGAPVTLLDGGILILQIVPFSAFSPGSSFPFDRAARDPNEFPTILDTMARRHQITFDGLLITSSLDPPPKPQRAYTQVHRTGAVEAVATSLARGQNHDSLILPQLDAIIIRYSGLYMHSLHALGIEPPFAVLTSLVGVKGMRILEEFVPAGALWEDMPSTTLTQDQYHFIETIVDPVPANDREAAMQLRGTLDHIANAAGLASSPSFNASGTYTRTIPPQGMRWPGT